MVSKQSLNIRLIFSLKVSRLAPQINPRAHLPDKAERNGSRDAASKRVPVKSFAANFGFAYTMAP
jgi:hypothetical protein